MLDINMEEVDSSNIHSIGYDENSKTLRIRFHSSMELNWDYENVPESRYVGLRDADSVGKYFNAHIKGAFPYTKGAA